MSTATFNADMYRIDGKNVASWQTPPLYPEQEHEDFPGNWTSRSNDYGEVYEGFYEEYYNHKIRNISFRIPISSVGTINSLTVKLTVTNVSTSAKVRAALFDSLPANNGVYIDPRTGSYVSLVEPNISTSASNYSITFSGLSIDASKQYLYVVICPQHTNDAYPLSFYVTYSATVEANITYPAFSMSLAPTTITTQETTTASFEGRLGRSVALTISDYSSGTTLKTATVNADSYTITPALSWFTTAGVTAMQMTVKVLANDGLRPTIYKTFTLKKPELTFSFQYASIGTGQQQKITFQNRLSQTLTLKFDYAGVRLINDVTVSADTYTFTPTNDWFTAANISATSISVNVTATDATYNRSYRTNFQLKRSAVVTNVSPASGASVTATDEMTWTWSVTGGTTQKKAELYINNTKVATIDGSTTSWTSNYRPAAGTVSWYVKVTNNLDVVSNSTATSYTLSYSGQSKLVPVNSTTSGYILRKQANTFSAEIIRDPDYGTPEHDFTLSSPKFYYKKSTASSWTSVNMTRISSNRAATVTIAANTFTAAEYNWYITATDNEGNTRTTDTFTINANAAPITATPVTPIDSIENANTETVFTWADSSPIDSAQQAAELQYSTDNSSFSSLGSVSDAATEYRAPAGAIQTSGTIWWRVRAQNTDSSWGSWSSSVSYINFGAPIVSNVVATNRPKTTITWTVDSQQAYRITVDSTVYGPFFGADNRSFQIPDYLPDGVHTATVEAQNEYGMWSSPRTTQFTVTNDPGSSPVTLSGIFRRDAELSWASDSSSQEFYVFRDGVKVAHVRGYEWLDRTVLGFHVWEILQPLAGGYYVKSNAVQGTLCTDTLAIAPLAGGEWLDLTRSTNSGRSVNYNFTQAVAIRQFAGQIWPQAEASPYRTLSVSFDAAWTHEDKAQADAFAAMVGKPVIWKDCEGALIGILTAWTRSNTVFYRAFNATIQRIHWEDYIDEDR